MPKDLILMPLFGEAYFIYLTRNKSLLEKRTFAKALSSSSKCKISSYSLFFIYFVFAAQI